MVRKMHVPAIRGCLTNPVVIAVAGQAKPKPIQANFKPIPGDFIYDWRLPS